MWHVEGGHPGSVLPPVVGLGFQHCPHNHGVPDLPHRYSRSVGFPCLNPVYLRPSKAWLTILSPWSTIITDCRQCSRRPKAFSLAAFAQFSKTYGTLLSFSEASSDSDHKGCHVFPFGRVIVVLNLIKAANDSLETKGDVYFGRAVLPFYEM